MNSNDTQPIIFEQRYLRMEEAEEAGSPKMPAAAVAAKDSPHLIVFVHGFMGNSYDLRCVREPNPVLPLLLLRAFCRLFLSRFLSRFLFADPAG